MTSTYRISKVDMEATRLVFVMLKDAKPQRKVAIPITDNMSWHAFEGQVRRHYIYNCVVYAVIVYTRSLL
jgi:hypothetical protein